MRKQKSATAKACYCEQYRFEQKKLKSMIIEKLKFDNQYEQWSNQKLLKAFFQFVDQRNKHIESIDEALRSFIKQEPTIHYTQNDTIMAMIDALITKVKKQREVHQNVLKQERLIIQKHVSQEQKLVDQIDYLKQLLKEEQREVETWKAEAVQNQKRSLNFKKMFQRSHLQNQQLKLSIQEQKDIIQKNQNKLFGFQRDNSELSKQIFQKSEEMARLKQQLHGQIHRIKYQAKLQAQRHYQTFQNQIKLSKLQSKKQIVELQAQKKGYTENYHTQGPKNNQAKNLSLSYDRHNTKLMNLDSTLSLNRSVSSHHEASQNSWIQKNNSLLLTKEQIFSHLFVGDALFDRNEMRSYLVQLLQKCQKNLIVRTRLLYRLDYLNNINIHRYIDGRHNIVFLFRTDNQQFIAAYSRGAFRAKSISNHLGLLVSLNNKMEFKNAKRAIVYDQNEIIFGNFDLRYKTGDNKVASNFGMSGTFYEIKGQSVSVLLGEGKNREVKIKNLEVFQVIFQA